MSSFTVLPLFRNQGLQRKGGTMVQKAPGKHFRKGIRLFLFATLGDSVYEGIQIKEPRSHSSSRKFSRGSFLESRISFLIGSVFTGFAEPGRDASRPASGQRLHNLRPDLGLAPLASDPVQSPHLAGIPSVVH